MRERPILFSGPMVRAILEGRKVQTRRVVKGAPAEAAAAGVISSSTNPASEGDWSWLDTPDLLHASVVGDVFRCPYGVPGDRLWVRETHAPGADQWGAWGRRMRDDAWGPSPVIYYAADGGERPFIERWRPSIHMPRWACRLVLDITDVRIERLNAISEADCCAEGVGSPITRDYKRPKFQALWERINGHGSWDQNPWVWVVSFERPEVSDAH